MLVLEVTDRGLHGRAPAERAFDGGGEPSLLTCHVDLEALVLRCVVALVPGVGDDPLEASADGALNVREDGCERVPVIGIAGERLRWCLISAILPTRTYDWRRVTPLAWARRTRR